MALGSYCWSWGFTAESGVLLLALGSYGWSWGLTAGPGVLLLALGSYCWPWGPILLALGALLLTAASVVSKFATHCF